MPRFIRKEVYNDDDDDGDDDDDCVIRPLLWFTLTHNRQQVCLASGIYQYNYANRSTAVSGLTYFSLTSVGLFIPNGTRLLPQLQVVIALNSLNNFCGAE